MSIAVAFSLTPTFAAIVASIQNSVNTAATGTLVLEEKGPNASGVEQTCLSSTDANNTYTCETINKYGGTDPTKVLLPGGTGNTTTLTFTNKGSLPASTFTVTGGTCTSSPVPGASASGSSNLCDKVIVTIMDGTTQVYSGTATAFASAGAQTIATSLAPGASKTLTVNAKLDASADATYQGLQISQPITWQFNG